MILACLSIALIMVNLDFNHTVFVKSAIENIRLRSSKRSYTKEVLSDELISKIESLAGCKKGPFGNTAEFSVVTRYLPETQKLKLGTYGFIQGARHFMVGQIGPGTTAFLDYGYLLEEIILELTELGLGTCWLGGTFDRSEFAKAIALKEKFVIPAITPFGFATSKRSLGDQLIRLGAGSKARKPWSSLFFSHEAGKPLHEQELPELVDALEMLRLAPSASNHQPWRLIFSDGLLHFFLDRRPGYQRMFGSVDLQMVDMGIALCHFHLAAREQNISVEWMFNHPVRNDLEYILSAKLKN